MNSQKNLFYILFCSIVLVHGVRGASFRIHSLEIFTSDCHDCGVGVLGEVSVKVIIKIFGTFNFMLWEISLYEQIKQIFWALGNILFLGVW